MPRCYHSKGKSFSNHFFQLQKLVKQNTTIKLINNFKEKSFKFNTFFSKAFDIVQKQFNENRSVENNIETAEKFSIFIGFGQNFSFKFKISSIAQCKVFDSNHKVQQINTLIYDNLRYLVLSYIFVDSKADENHQKKGIILCGDRKILVRYIFGRRNKSKQKRKICKKSTWIKNFQKLRGQQFTSNHINMLNNKQEELHIKMSQGFLDHFQEILNRLEEVYEILNQQIILLYCYILKVQQTIYIAEENQHQISSLQIDFFQCYEDLNKNFEQNLQYFQQISTKIDDLCTKIIEIDRLSLKKKRKIFSQSLIDQTDHFQWSIQSKQNQQLEQQLQRFYLFYQLVQQEHLSGFSNIQLFDN